MTVRIEGPTKIKATVGLVLTARGCKSKLMTLACTLVIPHLKACPAKKACYTASVATYDAFDSASNKIPPGAHELSAEQKFSFRIAQGRSNVIPIVLQGIPSSVAFLPRADTTLSGTQDSGFVEPKCSASAQSVTVLGIDADGNYILGAGAPKAALASDDAAQLSVSPPVSSAPNTFTLVPPSSPAYAFGNHTTHLTATVKPGAKSGAKSVGTVVDVTYSGDICGILTEFTIPTSGSEPHGISAGADGNVWFAEEAANKIGRITPAGSITEFPIPTAASRPFYIAQGPDGNVWFTELATQKIGKMTTAGSAVDYPISPLSDPVGIAPGPDHNMWFAESGTDMIGKITTSGSVSEYPVTSGSHPTFISAGPDGNMWFDEYVANRIGRITTLGSVAEYTTLTSSSGPSGIATGPDGGMWFAECASNKIGRIETSGVVTSEFPLPEAGSGPGFLTRGPDNGLWFTEFNGNRIGGITVGGAFTEYAVPTGAAEPLVIATGPDGALWFVEFATNKIGRLR
jgi:streptogramin lyase